MFEKLTRSRYMTENVTDELIRLENLVKIYDTGAIRVMGLKKINLTIHRGEPRPTTTAQKPSLMAAASPKLILRQRKTVSTTQNGNATPTQ